MDLIFLLHPPESESTAQCLDALKGRSPTAPEPDALGARLCRRANLECSANPFVRRAEELAKELVDDERLALTSTSAHGHHPAWPLQLAKRRDSFLAGRQGTGDIFFRALFKSYRVGGKVSE